MAQKKKRTPKTSKGIHGGARRTRLDEVQKVLLGKGLFASMRPIGSRPQTPPAETA